MNIFGEGFPEEIINQITHRQKVYGSGYAEGISRTPEEILYLNSRTAWCKMSSAVNIEEIDHINNPTIKSLGLKGDALSKQFVLFNGTADSTSKNLRAGINLDNSLLGGDNAYGIGGNEFGIRPMMGIISANVTHENRGSLRRAEVKIKAFNRTQFEIIDVLYLRLGFHVLLEWGNSMIINKDGNIETNPSEYSLSSDFLNGTIDGKAASYKDFLKKIHDQRIASCGNYDAMLAKVTNFHWSFLADGSYDITVNLSSVGDIIESLNINVLLDGGGSNQNQDTGEDAGEVIASWAKVNTIGNFFYMIKNLLNDYGEEDKGFMESLSFNDSDVVKKQSTITNNPNLTNFNLTKFLPNMIDCMYARLDNSDWGGGAGIVFGANDSEKYYVRLGTFLQFLQEYIVPRTYSNSSTESTPLLSFDFDESTNIMNLHPLQVSIDPSICIVNRKLDLTRYSANSNVMTFTFGRQDQKNPFQNTDIVIANRPDLYANIMNIYIDCAFILTKIDESKDDKGNLALIDFLQNIMKSVNEALGGINDFDIFIDETTNTAKIIDKNPLNNLDEVIALLNNANKFPTLAPNNNGKLLNTKPAFFDLYGYYEGRGEASFIKEFNFTTELTPEFSTMITVGASAQGDVVGENDTALSRINIGLKDRYQERTSNAISDLPPEPSEAPFEAKKKEYEDMLLAYHYFLYNVSNTDWGDGSGGQIKVSPEDVATNKNTLSALIQKKIEVDNANEKTKRAKDAAYAALQYEKFLKYPGFIPFNLSLTLDGLSGMKINQQFDIDTRFLPSNYPKHVKFLIKNMSHIIENNKWVTRLESYCIARSMSGVNETNISAPRTTSNVSNNISNNTSNNPSTNGKWANELRAVISRLGYTEKGSELDSGGDISEEIYKAAASVLTTIKAELPNVNIKITAGNDRYHRNLSYTSRHKLANAIDFVSYPSDSATLDAIITILQRHSAGNLKFRFIDEYRHLTSAGTANHFHISWGEGSESRDELDKALALARSGRIQPIQIT